MSNPTPDPRERCVHRGMNANALRATLVALMLAGGALTACRLTAQVQPTPAPAADAAAKVCGLGQAC